MLVVFYCPSRVVSEMVTAKGECQQLGELLWYGIDQQVAKLHRLGCRSLDAVCQVHKCHALAVLTASCPGNLQNVRI